MTKENKILIYPSISDKLKYDSLSKCINAFEVITDPDTLKMAYGMIKSNPGNMVRGTDNITLDGINNK